MNITLSKEAVFIPDFNGNKELPAADQITVRYRIPTLVIKNRCRKKPVATGITNKTGGIDHMEIVIERDDLQTLNEMLVSISGCSYKSEGKDYKITNAADLINAPVFFEPLYKEIIAEFDEAMDKTEIDEKN